MSNLQQKTLFFLGYHMPAIYPVEDNKRTYVCLLTQKNASTDSKRCVIFLKQMRLLTHRDGQLSQKVEFAAVSPFYDNINAII